MIVSVYLQFMSVHAVRPGFDAGSRGPSSGKGSGRCSTQFAGSVALALPLEFFGGTKNPGVEKTT